MQDRVEDIVRDAGRFASEVDIVLGALRVAQTLVPWSSDAKEWEKAGRPTPDRVRFLHEKGTKTTEPYFRSMLPEDDNAPRRLQTAIKHLHVGLLYDTTSNACGLPSMLLVRLPRDLLDVLLLFTFKRDETRTWDVEDRSTLIAFVLHWLLFVADDNKAAYCTFVEAGVGNWYFGQRPVAALLCHFEAMGAARHAPRAHDWHSLTEETLQRGCRLATWAERFISKDVADHPSPGEAPRQVRHRNFEAAAAEPGRDRRPQHRNRPDDRGRGGGSARERAGGAKAEADRGLKVLGRE